MRDPFRPEKNTQLIREAQIGLSVVAIMLSLFLYVAFYKIAGRGRHIPEHVRNAPIAETVYAEMPPANEVAMTPNRYLDERKSLINKPIPSHQISQARPTFDPDQTITQPVEAKVEPGPREFPRVASRQISADNKNLSNVTTPKTSLTDRLSNFVSGYGQKKGSENQAFNAQNAVEINKANSSSIKPEPQDGLQNSSPSLAATDSNIKLASGESTRPKEMHGFTTSSEPAPLRLNQNSFTPVSEANIGVTNTQSVAPLEQQPTAPNEFKPLPKRSLEEPTSDGETKTNRDSNSFDLSPLRKPNAASESADSIDSKPQLDSAQSTFELPGTSATEVSRPVDSSFLSLDSAPSIKAPQPIAYQPKMPNRLPRQRLPMPPENEAASVSNALREPNSYSQKNNFSLRPNSEQASVDKPIQTLTADRQTEFSKPVEQLTPPNTHLESHIAREGESFWSIASDIYDDPRFFHALYKVNETATASFEQLDPGTKLETPTKAELIRLWPELCPRADSQELNSDAASRFYVTKEGETLFGIAGRVLNQKSRYLEIYHANQVRLDSLADLSEPLPAGTRLVLPRQ